MTAHQRAVLRELATAFRAVRAPLRTFKQHVLADGKANGLAHAQRTYDHWWNTDVRLPVRHEYARLAKSVAALRLARIDTELKRRYPTRSFPVSDNSIRLALHRAFTRTRKSGDRVWRYTDAHWPVDRYLRFRFATALDHAQRRAAAINLQAAAGSAGFDDPVTQALATGKAPKINPDLTMPKFVPDDPMALLDDVLDDVAMARGEYYIAVGMRDLAREVEQLVSRAESERVPQIVGWRWVLSDAHTEEKCPQGECLDYSTADVGHPYGAGVYFDLLFPESHPNCWCDMEEVWADDGDDAAVPEPDEGYEDRIRALVEQYHPMLSAA